MDHYDRYKLLIVGYIRQIETISKSIRVPHEIIDIMCEYEKIDDIWDAKQCSKQIKITGNIITMISDKSPTAFGSRIINKGIFEWKVQILKAIYSGMRISPPYVGIVADIDNNLFKYKDLSDWEDIGYMFCGGTARLLCMDFNSNAHSVDCYKTWQNPGDIVEIILDLNRKTLRFIVNGADCGVTFKNIQQTGYRLAVGVSYCKGSKFELLTQINTH